MIAAVVILFIVALTMLIVGLRGKAVDDHPLCPRCRFDLVGVLPRPSQCPECGRLIGPTTVLPIGNRERRRGMVRAAVSLLVVWVFVTVGHVGGTTFGLFDHENRPTWWLLHEAEFGSGGGVPLAYGELASRVEVGDLTRSEVRRLIDITLDRQADREAQWPNEATHALWQAHQLGAMTLEDYARFGEQGGWLVDLRIRDKVRQGMMMPLVVAEFYYKGVDGNSPFGPSYPVGFTLRHRHVEWRIDDRVIANPQQGWKQYGPGVGSNTVLRNTGLLLVEVEGPKASLTRKQMRRTMGAPGDHTLTVLTQFVLESSTEPGDPPLHTWTIETSAPFEIIPEDRSPVTHVKDAAKAKAIADQVVVNRCELVERDSPPGRPPGVGDKEYPYLNLGFEVPPLGTPLVFDLWIRAGDREWLINSHWRAEGKPETHQSGFVFRPEGGGHIGVSKNLPDFDAKTIDIILRPNHVQAEASVDVDEMLDETIVIPNVKVERYGY